MAKEVTYNNTLVSGTADETLTYTRYIKDESSGKSTKELLDTSNSGRQIRSISGRNNLFI